MSGTTSPGRYYNVGLQLNEAAVATGSCIFWRS